ncbi:MAG: hypothetical protein PHW03_02775 [Eubacteriales bacterium]|nr:hypothetical protein [Eubacteriales bacterium]
MRLSELITQAQTLKDKHGDLEILDTDYYSICGLRLRTFERLNSPAAQRSGGMKS